MNWSLIADMALGLFVGVLIAMAMLSMIATAVSAVKWAREHNNYED